MLKFERLIVWQKALELTAQVHELTKKFPKDELYILTAQIKRAADSVALNIAEGSTGQTDPEFRQFLGYAVRSAVEVVGCLHIGRKREMINEKDFKRVYDQTVEVLRMIHGLRNSLKLTTGFGLRTSDLRLRTKHAHRQVATT